VSKEAKDFINSALRFEAKERPSAKEIFKIPWIKNKAELINQ